MPIIYKKAYFGYSIHVNDSVIGHITPIKSDGEKVWVITITSEKIPRPFTYATLSDAKLALETYLQCPSSQSNKGVANVQS